MFGPYFGGKSVKGIIMSYLEAMRALRCNLPHFTCVGARISRLPLGSSRRHHALSGKMFIISHRVCGIGAAPHVAAGWAPQMDSIDDETQDVLDKILQTFNSADANGDGKLQRDELRDLLERAGGGAEFVPLHWLTEGDLDAIFDAYDANKDGEISFEEFVPLAQDNVWLAKELATYRAVFKAIDTGRNGKLSPTELCTIFTQLDSPLKDYNAISHIMEKYDLDRNGMFMY